jgi:hypothetical protein
MSLGGRATQSRGDDGGGDPNTINACLLLVSGIKGIHAGFEQEVTDLKDKASKLRNQIAAAYHLKTHRAD